jgi:large-conductance mechanosensitive channel
MKNKYLVLIAIIVAVVVFFYIKYKNKTKAKIEHEKNALKAGLALAAIQQNRWEKTRADRIRKEQLKFIES